MYHCALTESQFYTVCINTYSCRPVRYVALPASHLWLSCHISAYRLLWLLFFQHTYGTEDRNRDCIYISHLHLNIYILLYALTNVYFWLLTSMVSTQAFSSYVWNVVRVQCDGVRLDFFFDKGIYVLHVYLNKNATCIWFF